MTQQERATFAESAPAAARSQMEREDARNQWDAKGEGAAEAMNQRIAKIGSPARRIHEWRKARATRKQNATIT